MNSQEYEVTLARARQAAQDAHTRLLQHGPPVSKYAREQADEREKHRRIARRDRMIEEDAHERHMRTNVVAMGMKNNMESYIRELDASRREVRRLTEENASLREMLKTTPIFTGTDDYEDDDRESADEGNQPQRLTHAEYAARQAYLSSPYIGL
jgi:hypothetical protein